jgi:hypothetical protein
VDEADLERGDPRLGGQARGRLRDAVAAQGFGERRRGGGELLRGGKA